MRHLLFALFTLVTALVSASDIALITLTVGEKFQEDTIIGVNNKRYYCEKHGYHFINYKKSLDEKRKLGWSKVLLTHDVMNNSDYKWIVWMDADTLIMNMDKKIEDIIDEKYDLIIGNEGTEICSGVYLIRNCKWSKRFLEEVYDEDKYMAGRLADHEAFDETYKAHNPSHTKVLPLREIAAYAPEHEGAPAEMYYQPGDYVIHFEHLKNHAGIKELFEKYSKLEPKMLEPKLPINPSESINPPPANPQNVDNLCEIPPNKIDELKLEENLKAFMDKYIIPPTYKGIINDYITFVKESISKNI